MAYNKYREFENNLNILEEILSNTSELSSTTKAFVETYKGFGAIKEVLYANDSDLWNSGNVRMRDLLPKLNNLIDQFANSNASSPHGILESLKNSTATAFYTPNEITDTIAQSVLSNNSLLKTVLEPSAGTGNFIKSLLELKPQLEVTAIEQDILTSCVGKALYQDNRNVEFINKRFQDIAQIAKQYDLVISNIPFGQIKVYDKGFLFSKNAAERKSLDRVHNYFFMRGLEKVKEGGLLAFITTSSFFNSPSNQIFRNEIFSNADLVSAVRFPDSMFENFAGTKAPSDLLIVRKNSNKIQQDLTLPEQQLTNTIETDDKIIWNEYFYKNRQSIIHDSLDLGHDQYGKRDYEVKFNSDAKAISESLSTILNSPKILISKAESTASIKAVNSNAQNLKIKSSNTTTGGGTDVAYYEALLRQKGTRKVARAYSKKVSSPDQLDLFSKLQDIDTNVIESKIKAVPTQRTASLPKQASFDFTVKNSPTDTSTAQNEVVNNNGITRFDELRRSSLKEGMIWFDGEDFSRATMNVISGGMSLQKLDINQLAADSGVRNFKADLFVQILHLRNTYLDLYFSEAELQTENKPARALLNDRYNDFVSSNGVLNKPSNMSYLKMDEPFYYDMRGIEVQSVNSDGKVNYSKTGIFDEPVNIRKADIQVTDEKSALIYSFNKYGHIKIDEMAAVSGIDRNMLLDKLSDQIIFNPKIRDYELKASYLSENIYDQISEFDKTVSDELSPSERNKFKSEIAKARNELFDNIPEKIPFDQLDVHLGERWVDTPIFEQFATDLFESATRLKYQAAKDEYTLDVFSPNFNYTTLYSVPSKAGTKSAKTIFEAAIVNQSMIIKYSVGTGDDKQTFVDNEGSKVANNKIEEIREKFKTWLTHPSQEQIRKHLTDKYNRLFNGVRLQDFDGSLLDLKQVNFKALGIPDLYKSQKDAVMKAICLQGGIVDHVPGGGKTLIQAVQAHEMKKIGLASKPMILGLKTNIQYLAATYKKAFPQDKIIAPTVEDFSKKNRLLFLNQIKNNNWDAIFLTHDQFARIEQDPAMQKMMMQRELADLNANIDSEKSEPTRAGLKGLQMAKQNLEVKLMALNDRINNRKDDLPHFGELGIDHIIVDESHMFKNLRFATRHTRVAGMGNPDGSQRAFNLLLALRTMQEQTGRDHQATFYSGTTLSNSLTELYLLFKYLTPKELEKRSISNFDAWASIYARKSTEYELNLANQFVLKERFRGFSKVPELIKDYRRITDYRDANDIGLDRPNREDIMCVVKQTPAQKEYFAKVLEFLEKKDPSILNLNYSESQLNALSLIATNLCSLASIDMRLIDPSHDDHPKSKLNTCANNVYERYLRHNDVQGTQLVFSDIGTPGSANFDLYADLKNKLVDKGIKSEEIGFIHDYDADKKKAMLHLMMENGQIRVLIGSTSKMGTGLDIQDRVVTMHQLTLPWKPSDIDQRVARGQRTGNWVAKLHLNNVVENIYYCVEDSPEVAKLELLKNKSFFISQAKSNTISARTIDEGDLSEDTGMSYGDMIAMLSGNKDLVERNKLEKKLTQLLSMKDGFQASQTRNLTKLSDLKTIVQHREKIVEDLALNIKHYKSVVQYEKGSSEKVINRTQLDDFTFSKEQQLGAKLLEMSKSTMNDNNVKIGNLYGFNLFMAENHYIDDDGKRHQQNTFYAKLNGKPVEFNNGFLYDKPERAARYFINSLNRMDSILERESSKLFKDQEDLKFAENASNKTFEKHADIKDLQSKIKSIDERIAKDLDSRREDPDNDLDVGNEQEPQKGPKR